MFIDITTTQGDVVTVYPRQQFAAVAFALRIPIFGEHFVFDSAGLNLNLDFLEGLEGLKGADGAPGQSCELQGQADGVATIKCGEQTFTLLLPIFATAVRD